MPIKNRMLGSARKHQNASPVRSNTPPGRAKEKLRHMQVLDLRAAGNTCTQIAHQLRLSVSTVHNHLCAALQNEPTPSEKAELIQLELQRYEKYLRALEPGIKEGQVNAIEAALKVGHQKNKLLGLYPTPDQPTSIIIGSQAHRGGFEITLVKPSANRFTLPRYGL